MKKIKPEIISNSERKIKKIGFFHLYKKFEFKVIRHFLISVLSQILQHVLHGAFFKIFQIKDKKKSELSFYELLPERFNFIGKIVNGWWSFFIFWLIFVVVSCFVSYWDNVWENELRAKGGSYVKNTILEKFRNLTFEQKKRRSGEVNGLIDYDAREIRRNWEHLPNHTFHNVIKIFLSVFFYWDKIISINRYQAICFALVLAVVNSVSFLYTRKIINNEMKLKEELTKESAFIEKEKSNIILIESSGLSSSYKNKQREITRVNEQLSLEFAKSKSANRYIPFILEDFLPFFLLFISDEGKIFDGTILSPCWSIINSFKEIISCFWSYGDYRSSLLRINKFIESKEKEENNGAIKFSSEEAIKKIDFINICFRYDDQKNWQIENYNNSFEVGKINYLTGRNGFGKSTLLYLLLGMLFPQEGKIVINGEKTINDLKDLDLIRWRESEVAYCSHQNLIDEGSTGQRQLENINQLFKNKRNAKVWLFDESDNALDDTNRAFFNEKINDLVKAGKLVIRIKH